MARKKKNVAEDPRLNAAPPTVQLITETLEKNYMPYAMSVIVSRAIPEIDGFKPSHRKLLYTMYKMGLLKGGKIKSANIVGQTMQLNPHGDASIYDTMVRLTKGHEALLHPFIDSKGSFGKHYSRSDPAAASRYTEAKLDVFCNELFSGIDKNAVDFVPNYDNTTTEPTLLPTTFPNILISPNLGIAVGISSSICSFNLAEICDGTIALLKNPNTTVERLLDIIKAPDFPGGAKILYDREQMKRIYETGYGSFKQRASYEFDKKDNTINIHEIPYSSSVDAIIKKAKEMIKLGKLREVSDVKDLTDINGLKIAVSLKKDSDHELVMQKLFAATELENNFDCNFNVLVGGTPYQLGVKEILLEWIKFRIECVRREITFDLQKKKDKLHLLEGLAKILLDIDKAIKIIRKTERDEDVVPNLCKGFDITKIQAEYVADIKLRYLNREYIINRVKEIDNLRAEIKDMEETLKDEIKLKYVIIASLQTVKKTYGKPRRTEIIEKETVAAPAKDIFFENYNCKLVCTRGGYFKKLSVQAARIAEEHKLKEGDFIIYEEDTDNKGEVLFFTDKGQIYRAKVSDFELTKASQMGDYIPSKLSMDDDEHVVYCKMVYDLDPKHNMVYIFENGKGVRISLGAYEAKTKRKKITGAYSSASPLAGAVYEPGKPVKIFIRSDGGKGMLIKSDLIPEKTTRTAGGTQIMQLPKKRGKVEFVTDRIEELGEDATKCRKLAIPSTGVSLGQMTFKF